MPSPYDRLAANYDRALNPLERWFLYKLRQQTLAELPHEGCILELGAGTGLNFIHYPPDIRGVATEPNSAMLQIARTKSRPEGLQLVQNSAEQLPFAASSFDGAFATLVFCSVISPAQAFRELRRVVRPGGQVVLLEHVRPNGILGPLFDLLSCLTVPLFDDHLNRRTADEARAAGLEVVSLRKYLLGIINLISCRA